MNPVFSGALRIGTRGSALALAQANSIALSLKKKFPQLKVQITVIKTTGDRVKEVPLSQIGRKGLFVKEIEEELLRGAIDLAVHSLKDLPTEIPKKLSIGAILKRENPQDCLASVKKWTLKSLPEKARVGTSSLRRQAQLLCLRPDLRVENLRGNLDTRIRKLKEGGFDAIVVAMAGVKRLKGRLKFSGVRFYPIPYAQMLPAVGQGSLALEVRTNDERVNSLIRFLNHKGSYIQALCERAFLKTLQGGCQIPVGAFAKVKGNKIFLGGLIASPAGEKIFRNQLSGSVRSAEKIGVRLANKLLKRGGKEILEAIRN